MMTKYFQTCIDGVIDAIESSSSNTVMVEQLSDCCVVIAANNGEEYFVLTDKRPGTTDEMVSVDMNGAIEMRQADLQGALPLGDEGDNYVPIWGRCHLISVDSYTPYGDVYEEVVEELA